MSKYVEALQLLPLSYCQRSRSKVSIVGWIHAWSVCCDLQAPPCPNNNQRPLILRNAKIIVSIHMGAEYKHSLNTVGSYDTDRLTKTDWQRQTHNFTSDGPVECKGQGPCGIIAVLCITICFIPVQIEWGRVSVSCVSILILRPILRYEEEKQS